MTRAAEKAGRGIRRDFRALNQLEVTTIGPGGFVSEADHRAERSLARELGLAGPGYGFLMEEAGKGDRQN